MRRLAKMSEMLEVVMVLTRCVSCAVYVAGLCLTPRVCLRGIPQ